MRTLKLPPAGPLRTALYAALLGALTSTAATAQSSAGLKAPAVLPQSFPDVKGPINSPTVKNGVHAQDNSLLSLEERRALDAAVSDDGSGTRSTDLQHAMAEGKGPFKGRDGDIKPTQSMGDHLQLDVDPDGTLWAFGGTYKASFNADGATYIPFLGADTPRNFPVSFRAPTITINGELIDTPAKAAPVFSDTTAVFDRAGVRELYDVRKGELEQLFVFDELDQRGEIVVRTRIDSELAGHGGADGLRFVGEHGSVGYSTAIAIDGNGHRSPVSTRFVDGEIVLRVPAAFVESAALPLTIDPVITTFVASGDATRRDFSADIAYDDGNARWMVVWQRQFSATDADVYAEAFTPSGVVVPNSGAYIDFTGTAWSAPRIANNARVEQFLVVATVAGSESKVWGRTREAEDMTMGTPFQIASTTGDCEAPDVGGDAALVGPTYYMVAWERRFVDAVDHDIFGQLITTDGALQSSLISIDNSGSTYDKVPSVSKSAGLLPFPSQRWNIVWQRQFSTNDWDIRGAQYRWDGLEVASSFSLNFSSSDDRWPQASSLLDQVSPSIDRQWLMVCERRWSDGISDLNANVMNGASPQPGVNVSSLLVAGEDRDQIQPSVDASGLQFAVTWSQRFLSSATDFDVYVAGLYLAGSDLYVSEGPLSLATSLDYEGNVQACARHSGGTISDWVGVAWQDHNTSGNHDVEAGVYECLDHYSNIAGTRYCGPAIPNSTGLSAELNASGSAVAGPEALILTAWNMPAGVFGYIIGSPNSASVLPGGTDGRICVGNPLSRFNAGGLIQSSGALGTFQVPIDTEAIPSPSGGTTALVAGQTFHFQAWFRDGASSNLTDGVRMQMH